MGTNTVAFNYLKVLEEEVMLLFPDVERKLRAVLSSTGYSRDDWIVRVKRLGFESPFLLSSSISQFKLRKLFVNSNVDEGYFEFCAQSTGRFTSFTES